MAMPCFEPLESRQLLSGSLMITEFMADNASVLADVDGQFNDWIELQNTSAAPINLSGWKLQDTNNTWTFPVKTLAPGEFIVVFASGKNRTNPAAQLHTNFNLAKAGEPLQLLRPDNSIEQSFNPFPEQFEDVSYGVNQGAVTLLTSGAPLSYLVPTAGNAGLGTTWTQPAFDDSGFASTVNVPGSTVLITEVSTGSEWIEFQNVSAAAVNTAGWVMAVSHDNSNINVVNPIVKALPSQLNALQVSYFSDSGSDPVANQWGGGISFQSFLGNGWALIMNEAGVVVDFVAWGFSASTIATFNVTINGTNVTAANLPWSGAGVSGNSSSASLKRTGNTDSNTSTGLAFTSNPTKNATNANLTLPFPVGAVSATSGIGYSNNAAGSGIDVTLYRANITVDTLAKANGVINTPSQQTQVNSGKFDTVNFTNTTSTGVYPLDKAFPGTTIGTNVDNYVSLSTTKIYIPRPGKWTFGVRSDDGFGLDITGNGAAFHSEFPGVRGPADTLATFDFTAAGIYDLRLVQFDGTGGSELELFAAEGTHTAWSAATFDLVGDVQAGGINAAGFAPDIRTNVQPQMRNVNSSIWTRFDFNVDNPAAFDSLTLKMKYDAGFVAYLNGVAVASRNAPGTLAWNSASTAERLTSDAAFFESINISSFLSNLVAGNNVLAIHGLNSSAADDDFILLPQIDGGSTGGTLQYFSTASPGFTNAGGVTAFVKDTKFSHDRGFYDAAFQLAITTNTGGATIRYTTNGSTPTTTTGTVYTGPITIDKTTVVRAIAYKAGFQPTDVDTQTFFFVSDILTQSAATATALGFPSGSVNGQVLDYGMDPDIVNSPTWGPLVAQAMVDIPSMSIVTDVGNLFNASTGIYVNADQDGELWERPISLEMIDPSGLEEGFQIDAGLRLRGGFSRSDSNPKHSFRFFFREEYEGDLFYPLFGDEGVDRFDKVDLRTSQNYSWAFQNDARNIMNRDVFFRDLQRDMGDPHTRSRYYHLYLNGQYWGLYQTQERSEANYAAAYFGGEPEDYDVVKVEAGPYTINATDGNLTAWNTLWTLATQGFETNAKYYNVLGKNADGTRNPALPVYVDQDSLIDYMIGILYGGNLDAPISNFLSNNSPNNWYGVYNRTTADQGFKFFAHDSEHTLLMSNLNVNRNGPWPAGDSFDKSNPQWLHQKLMAHPEYRMRFADRVQKFFFNDGALTVENNIERFLARADQIDLAIVGESARWGDAKNATPYTKTHWQAEINNLVTNYFPARGNIVLNQFKATTLASGAAAPLFPSINAPSFNQHGGVVGMSFPLTITAGAGTIYYTLDGTDPRLPGGAINPAARIYSGNPAVLTSSGPVRTRALSASSEWSAINEAVFLVNTPPSTDNFVLTELHYNPPNATAAELAVNPLLAGGDFEFIEFWNKGSQTIDLYGVHFTAGVVFDFSDGDITTVAPGQRVLLVSNRGAFELRYGPGLPIAGEYEGQLADAGEQVTLVAGSGAVLVDVTYSDSGDWPGRADGDGSSLEVSAPSVTPIVYNDPKLWRSSSEYLGSPGVAGLGPDNRLVVNEVLSHTDPPLKDSIELFNTTASAINIGGWFLSDSAGNLSKFRIPNGTTIAAGGYLVFDEDDFNPGGGTLISDFSFDAAHGDEAYIMQADPATGKLIRFVDVVSFGAQANAESWGRIPNATGDLTPLVARSLGGANSNPRVGPLVISELNYQPVDPGNLPLGVTVDDLEFIEIFNPTNGAVDLMRWRIRGGADFDFPITPAALILAPHEALIIARFNPADPLNASKLAAFRSYYSLSGSVPILGGFTGNLSNEGESIRLERPDEPPADEPTFYPALLEDEADYDNLAPWPTAAAGGGLSLQRLVPAVFGSDPASWTAALATPGVHGGADTLAPAVTQVFVGGGWDPAFTSHLAAQGLGNAGYALPTGASQLTPLGWSNLTQVRIRFSEDVVVTQSHLAVSGVNTPLASIVAFNYDGATFTATWTFAGALGNDKWLIDLADAVTDTAGNALDGEWTTGAAAAQSGNGVAGGDFRFRFNVLPGDVEGDGNVDTDDVDLVRAAQFRSVSHPSYAPRHDMNGSGAIAVDDVVLVRNRLFTALPGGEPAPSPSGSSVTPLTSGEPSQQAVTADLAVSPLAAAAPLARLDARRVIIVAALFQSLDAAIRSRATSPADAVIARLREAAPWRVPFTKPAWMTDEG